jgi:hydroxymethylbilane synthase
LVLVDLRGNVPTRIEKLAQGDDYDAILLAEAGLGRLGFSPEFSESDEEQVSASAPVFCTRLPEDMFFPAAGQGAIGLEIRKGDARSLELASSIGHQETWIKVSAEREFLRLLDGGCHTPVGVYSHLSGNQIHLHARVFPESGGQPKVGSATDNDPIQSALKLFQSLK